MGKRGSGHTIWQSLCDSRESVCEDFGAGRWRRVRWVDYVEKESEVLIRIEETAALWASESCPHCNGKSVSGYDHAPERRWRHLNLCQLQSEIPAAPLNLSATWKRRLPGTSSGAPSPSIELRKSAASGKAVASPIHPDRGQLLRSRKNTGCEPMAFV